MHHLTALCLAALLLTGCANRRTTDVSIEDASQVHKLKSGIILGHRPVNVRTDAAGAVGIGALFGGGAGSLIGQTYGASLAGIVVGGVAGAFAHHQSESENAIEYTIALADGTNVVVTQLQGANETVFAAGTPVAVQLGAKVNRVLPAPSQAAAPRKTSHASARLGVRSCDKGPIGNSTRESCTEH